MSNPGLTKSYTAGGTINPYRIVKFGSADGEVVQAAAAADLSIGVAVFPGSAASAGERIDVAHDGIVDVEYGGTVTRGQKLTSDASGRAIAAVPSAGANAQIIGYAVVSAVSGDIADMMISPSVMQG